MRFALAASLLLAAAVAVAAARVPGVSAPPRPIPGAPRLQPPFLAVAPEFPPAAQWLNSSRPITMESLKGRVVILDFFTYCCINCLHTLPRLKAIEAKYAKAPVAVIGVHSGKFDQERHGAYVTRAIEKYEIEHPVVLDDDMAVWERWGVRAWPTLIFVDADGRPAHMTSGEPDEAELSEVIDALLARGRARGVLAADNGLPPLKRAAPGGALRFPGKVTAAGGRLYVSDTGRHRIIIARPDGTVERVFGGPGFGFRDGDASTARFFEPQGTALEGNTLYVADRQNHALRAVDLAKGTVTTIAGTGTMGTGRSPGGAARSIDLRSPWDVAVRAGGLDVAMAGTHQLWRWENGVIRPSVGSGREALIDGTLETSALAQPSGLALVGGTLYVADSETSAIRAVDFAAGRVQTLVGTGLFDFGARDGVGTAAQLQHPLGVAGTAGTLYVADSFNNKIRKIDLKTNTVSTVEPKGVSALDEPSGLALDGGTLYVADTNNGRIVAVNLNDLTAREVAFKFPAGSTP